MPNQDEKQDLEIFKISGDEDFKNINYKFSYRIKKSILKTIKTEIKRLDEEYKENKVLLDSYNKIIVDGVYYMIDRDNLTTSKLNGIHNSRIDMIKCKLYELGYGSKEKNEISVKSCNFLDKVNSSSQASFRIINQEMKKCSNSMISNLSVFSNQLTYRIELILTQKSNLQKLYTYIKTKF